MKELENKILMAIQDNAKINVHDLSLMFNVSEVEVVNLINDLEKNKIICGYHTLINWDKTDREIVTALIEVKVSPQKDLGFDKIAERIYNFSEVDSVYLMSGAYDFMVLIEGKSMKEVSRFVFDKLSTLDMVNSTATHFVLKKYKDHGVKFDDAKKDNRILVSA